MRPRVATAVYLVSARRCSIVLDEHRNDLALVAHQQARQRRGLGGARAFERRQRPLVARLAAQRMADRLLEAIAVETA